MDPKDEAFLRLDDVLRRTCLSRSALYRNMREGKFPKPVKVTTRVSAWKLSEVVAWMGQRVSA